MATAEAPGRASSSSNVSSSSNSKPVIPPGMVLGPDGKPCKICTAFRNWKPGTTEPDSNRDKYQSTRGANPGSTKEKARGAGFSAAAGLGGFAALAAGASASASASTSTTTTEAKEGEHEEMTYKGDGPPPDCPPDVEVLGRSAWTFLHTSAAYFPAKPTPAQRANMLALLRSLPVIYPCSWCAQDFGKDVDKHPPDVSSGEKLSEWLCQRHNEVNKKLGKPEFDCAKVLERWKDGPADGRCD